MDRAKRLLFIVALACFLFAALAVTAAPYANASSYIYNISLSTNSKKLAVGEKWLLGCEVMPSGADVLDLEWSISDESVAEITALTPTGAWIQALGDIGDEAVITVKTSDNSGVMASCQLTLTPPVSDILLWTYGDKDIIMINESLRLNSSVLPSDASRELSWRCSDDSKVLLTSSSSEGVTINARGGGPVSITAVAMDGTGFSKKFDAFVRIPITSLSLPEQADLFIDETLTLKPKFSPINTTDTTVRWRSDNKDIASVDKDGLVTAVGIGQTRIVALSSANGSLSGECFVTVTRPVLLINLRTAHPVIGVGGATRIIASIAPYNADNKFINWSSSDRSIATVDSLGQVTGHRPGIAMVTASAIDGSGVIGVLPIEVRDSLESLSLPAQVALYPGQSTALELTAIPWGLNVDNVLWSSSDDAVVRVSETGVITAVSQGKARVTARSGAGVSASCDVTVSETISDIMVYSPTGEIYKGDVYEAYLNDSVTLSAATQPLSAICEFQWRSDNTSVARVSSDGVLTAKSIGVARITVSAKDILSSHVYATKSFKVKVVRPVTSVTLTQNIKLLLGRKVKINAVVKPAQATNKSLTWASSNESVASVDKGVVTARSTGKAMITATSDNLVVGVTNVTVAQPVTQIELSLPEGMTRIWTGESFFLRARVLPGSADNSITWKSDNTSIATVSQGGRVTPRRAGKVTITATAKDKSGVKGSIKLNISTAVTGVEFKKTIIELFLGGDDKLSTKLLKPVVSPKSASGYQIIWSSSNPYIASVDDGNVTAVGEGVSIIKAEVEGHAASIIAKVMRLPSFISLPFDKMSIQVGDRVSIATDVSQDGSDTYLKWKSSKKRVAIINSAGLIKARRAGKTIISVTTRNGLKASFVLTVTK